MTFGFSRDDIGKFLNDYKEKKLLTQDPFQSLDQDGVGQLMKLAIEKARQVDPTLQEIGVTYVSCSPYRVPAARLAVAQAALDSDTKTALTF